MRSTFLATFLTFGFLTTAARPTYGGVCAENDPTPFLQQSDKQLHLAVSYGFTLTETLILEHYEVPRWKSVLISAATTLGLGLAKESFIDSCFSWHDMAANAGGTSAAAGMTFVFNF